MRPYGNGGGEYGHTRVRAKKAWRGAKKRGRRKLKKEVRRAEEDEYAVED